MAWNGSGTFSRITTSVSPAVTGTTIDSADMNTYTADVTSGINSALAKNGENAATSDLDIGGNLITNLGDGVADDDAATVLQVNTVKAGLFVNNANGEPTVNSTAFSVDTDVTQATWESVGESGATNTWSAMSSVPAGADWIEVKLGSLSTATSSANVDTDIYARQTGSSVAFNNQTQVGKLTATTAAATTESQAITFFKIPIDSNRHFDLYWDAAANNAAQFDLYLTGYGWN
jgi:hypothetical protein